MQLAGGIIARRRLVCPRVYSPMQPTLLRRLAKPALASTARVWSTSSVGARFAGSAASTTTNFDSTDSNYTDHRLPAGDGDSKRAFTYFMLGSGRFVYASAARLMVIKAIASLSASADVLAMASLEVDLSSIEEGQCVTVKWRGKPVFIKNRSEDQIKDVAGPVSDLRDNQTDAERAINPKWCVPDFASCALSLAVSFRVV
jgi:ubiquinol-cytochrome c reductase iron-sulfur subunit